MVSNTQDINDFGAIELDVAGRLLTAFTHGKPDFLGSSVNVEFNPTSGCVFLVDDDGNVGMLLDVEEDMPDQIGEWLTCPYCCTEGFLKDLVDEGNDCCLEYLESKGLIQESDVDVDDVEPGDENGWYE